eukprot:332020_1
MATLHATRCRSFQCNYINNTTSLSKTCSIITFMSDVAGKRKGNDLFIDDSSEEPSHKKRKIDKRAQIINIIQKTVAMDQRGNGSQCSRDNLENCLNLLLKLTIDQRTEIIETSKSCISFWCSNGNCSNCVQSSLLSKMIQGTSYKFLSKMFRFHELSIKNTYKLNTIQRISNPLIISNGESFRPTILTIKFGETDTPYELVYYKGAIEELEEFTAELFLDSVKDFNFFKFIKKVTNNKSDINYIDCNDKQVLNLLQTLKID